MKNKHYDMIVAWAEGKQIQNFNENTGEWQDLIAPPYWIQNFQYRIKPEEKQSVVRWLWAKLVLGEWMISPVYRSKEEASKFFAGQVICLEWSRQEFPE